ncbi:MAG: hypothetical protein IKH51_03145 [Clostridia bacterium]|nr:hypothetical protein [Clostridia bacterium]
MITETIRTAAQKAADRTAFITYDGDISYRELMKRAELRKTLPEYMIPKIIKKTGIPPVNKNGKLDGRAL